MHTQFMPILEIHDNGNDTVRDPLKMEFPDWLFTNSKRIVLDDYQARRFDKLVVSEYGSPYWEDLLLWLNNLDDPFNIPPGAVVFFPDESALNIYKLEYGL